MNRFLIGFLFAGSLLVLIGLGDWLRSNLGYRRGNEVLTLAGGVIIALTIAATSLHAGRLRSSAVAGATAVAIACGTAAWLVHENTQLSIAVDRVGDIESAIASARIDLAYGNGDTRREMARIIPLLQKELVARKLEERATVVRFRTSNRSSAGTVLLIALGLGTLAIASSYARWWRKLYSRHGS